MPYACGWVCRNIATQALYTNQTGHAGNYVKPGPSLSFQLVSALEALPQRICNCSYCRRHGPLWTSDAQGRVSFSWAPELAPIAYRFAHGTADFLCCARCGILLAAVSIAEPHRAVLNLRCSNQPAKPDSPTPTPIPRADTSSEVTSRA